jgi:hypothetical protein
MKSRVEICGDGTIRKTYSESRRHLFEKELMLYNELSFACPKLLDAYGNTLVIERCAPILDVDYNIRYKDQLWNLLGEIHTAGWWHADIALRNVVVHPERGVLLIDWESAIKATSDVSYDQWGAVAAGYPEHKINRINTRPTGIYWFFDWNECPNKYWTKNGNSLHNTIRD